MQGKILRIMHKVVSKPQTAYDAVFDPKNPALRDKTPKIEAITPQ